MILIDTYSHFKILVLLPTDNFGTFVRWAIVIINRSVYFSSYILYIFVYFVYFYYE